ncbi:hypothetical protein QN352_21130, partial [Mucilaginibacter sp. 10I4]|nr:hypothetical protein [Mucilaginibacter sp. 10I4]
DKLVLGCTHYPFVHEQIAAIAREQVPRNVNIIDTGAAVERQLASQLDRHGLFRRHSAASIDGLF